MVPSVVAAFSTGRCYRARVVRATGQDGRAFEVEEQLRAIWRRVLHVDDPRPDDDFFDLGGTSIELVEMIARVRESIDSGAKLETLCSTPTFAGMVAALATGGGEGLDPLVVKVQSGPRPIVSIHSAWGSALPMNDVARLDRTRGVAAVRAPGFEDGEPLPESVEQMAELYLAALDAHDLSPPYTLVGLCAGGVIAFEMAQQLGRASVECVGLLATDAPPASGEIPVVHDDFIRMFHYGRILALNVVSRGGDATDVDWDVVADQAHRMLPVHKAVLTAYYRYTPRFYDGRVVLFQFERPFPSLAAERIPAYHERQRREWEPYARVEVSTLPGCGSVDNGFEGACAPVLLDALAGAVAAA
jgi:thioesterase domain-containing protein/acyl carrier protein